MLGRPNWSGRCAAPGHVCSLRSLLPAPEDHSYARPDSAWTEVPMGQVLGLAPVRARSRCSGRADRHARRHLAKLTRSLRHGELPDWAAAVGSSTLIIIDEAGMADTLDAAVQFAIDRGARSGWSVMINNLPRSAPAACCATSNRPTAPCI